MVIEGDETALVIGDDDGNHELNIVIRDDEGWKIAAPLDTNFTFHGTILSGGNIDVFCHGPTNEHYLCISVADTGDIAIRDSYESEFHEVQISEKNGAFKTFYSFIGFYEEGYTFWLNDQEIKISLNE